MNPTTPIPEPREVLGLTASFSGIAAMLVIATLAPHPVSPAGGDSTTVLAGARVTAGGAHAVGV
jgi:hypothetical protein